MGKTFIRKADLVKVLGEEGYRKYIEVPMLRAQAERVIALDPGDLDQAEAFFTDPDTGDKRSVMRIAGKYAIENNKGRWALQRYIKTLRDRQANNGVLCALCDHPPFKSTQAVRMHHMQMVRKLDKAHKGKMQVRKEN